MAQSITNAFVTLFDAEVKQAYQGESSILGCVRLRQGVQGQTYKFPKLGKGSATARVPQTDVTPLNVTYSQVTATMSDFNAAEYSDIFHQAKVNFDERQELVQVVSKAIGRRMKRLAKKIARTKARMKKRMKNSKQLQTKANKQARSILFKKMSCGKASGELSVGARIAIGKKLDKKK